MRRIPKDRTKWLACKWDKIENDLRIFYPRREDGHFFHGILWHAKDPIWEANSNFLKELEKRGYDISTLYFEIKKKE